MPSSSTAASPSALTLSFSSSSSKLQCFIKENNTVSNSNWLPCGLTNSTVPNVPCCAAGDFCLSNGICHYTHSLAGGSGYYAGGCTDRTYDDDDACPQLCNDRLNKAVVYNSSTEIWSCCGANSEGKPNCGNPTNERFAAPADDQLETYYTAGITATGISGSSALGIATTVAAASSTNSTSASASPSLSTGAAVGVGVACGVVGLALIGTLIFFLAKRRRGGLAGNASPYKREPAELSQDNGKTPPPELASATLSGSQVPRDEVSGELEASIMPQELPVDNVPRETVPAATRDIPD